MFTKSFTFGLSMLLFLGGPAVAATKAIRLGKLVDGTGRVLTNAIVIVENDRIAAVTSAANTIPAGAEVVDLSRYTGIPGMIDAHTHMTYGPGAATPGTRSTIVNMVLGQDALKKTLEAGVTTVRDMNAADYVDVAMRDLVNMGEWVGPRMLVVGCGLRAPRTRYNPAGNALGCGEGNGPDEFARGPPADRGRRRLDQDLWVDGIRPGRQRISNRHI